MTNDEILNCFAFQSSEGHNSALMELRNGKTRAYFGSISIGDYDTFRDAFIALCSCARMSCSKTMMNDLYGKQK